MFNKKTIRDIPLDGQRILLRADYNVPMNGTKIDDDYRLVQSLPTLHYLLEHGCAAVICAHLGRPTAPDPAYSLEPVAAHLGNLLGQPVGFMPDCVGERIARATQRLQAGQVLVLENLRFHAGEQANDPAFARQLADSSSARYFVQDGFGVVYERRASTVAITDYLPSVAGLLLEKEVMTITSAMAQPKRPLVAILGGAKVSDKIKLIERFITEADQLIIGGAMATTFLAARHMPVGRSFHEADQQSEVERIYGLAADRLRGARSIDEFICLPSDVVAADSLADNASTTVVDAEQVPPDDYIVDIGPESAATAARLLSSAGTAIWNGTMGMAEQAAYSHGSARVAEALAEQAGQTTSLIGGGDTADFVRRWSREHAKTFGYISTGGGASLELMAGEKLPGVEALLPS